MDNSKITELEDFLKEEIIPRIEATENIKNVKVWIKSFNSDTGVLQLGMALGSSVGCSPFCGCAANQLAEIIGEEIKKKFDYVKRVVGVPELPPNRIIKF
ncbi:MAG: hypothetical protein NZ870_05095 [bacterium]|nr:hypothetical protein [bacterium]